MDIINSADVEYLKIIEDLHREWSPHAGQLSIGREFFNNPEKTTIFLLNK